VWPNRETTMGPHKRTTMESDRKTTYGAGARGGETTGGGSSKKRETTVKNQDRRLQKRWEKNSWRRRGGVGRSLPHPRSGPKVKKKQRHAMFGKPGQKY